MRIGEVARRANVTTSRIRFYESRGLLPRARRTANGYRDYPPSTVDSLSFIERAQALGFSLREIAPGLADGAAGKLQPEALVHSLERKLAQVESEIARAKALRKTLRALIDEQLTCVPARHAPRKATRR